MHGEQAGVVGPGDRRVQQGARLHVPAEGHVALVADDGHAVRPAPLDPGPQLVVGQDPAVRVAGEFSQTRATPTASSGGVSVRRTASPASTAPTS